MIGESITSGQFGSQLITDTTAVTGSFKAISVVSDCVFTTLTGNMTGTITGVTFPAGFTLYGEFTAITLASGSVIAYK